MKLWVGRKTVVVVVVHYSTYKLQLAHAFTQLMSHESHNWTQFCFQAYYYSPKTTIIILIFLHM
jgi:hypothetical protein